MLKASSAPDRRGEGLEARAINVCSAAGISSGDNGDRVPLPETRGNCSKDGYLGQGRRVGGWREAVHVVGAVSKARYVDSRLPSSIESATAGLGQTVKLAV